MQTPETGTTGIQVSLILPVYNVAGYLAECLQSIIGQSNAPTIEVLLIDDCSTDESLALCQQFAAQQPGLIAVMKNTENLGVSRTRNRGLEQARGDYFMFIDPDDVLPVDALRKLYDAAVKSDCDIVKGNNTIFDNEREHPAAYNTDRNIRIEGEQVLATLYQHRLVRGHPWGKLFHRERLGRRRFPEGVRMAQDLVYCAGIFSEANSLLLIDATVYRYRNHETGSTGRKFETGAYQDWLNSVEKIGEYATTRNQSEAYRGLQLRTVAQIARECRAIEPGLAGRVLEVIEQTCRRWGIGFWPALRLALTSPRALGHFLKYRNAMRRIRHNLRAAVR